MQEQYYWQDIFLWKTTKMDECVNQKSKSAHKLNIITEVIKK